MALPAGFDPATGTFRGIGGPQIQSSYNATAASTAAASTSYGSSFSLDYDQGHELSWWENVNDRVKSFGNWIDDKIKPVSGWITMISMILCAIGLIIWIFDDSNTLNIFLRILGACILGFILAICTTINVWILGMGMKIVRYIFWNIYTLLLAIVVIVGLVVWFNSDSDKFPDSARTEMTTNMASTYECTAEVLNIRTEPNKTSSVLGVLRKGDKVEILAKTDGFARIEYKGHIGYVSLDYLKKYKKTD